MSTKIIRQALQKTGTGEVSNNDILGYIVDEYKKAQPQLGRQKSKITLYKRLFNYLGAAQPDSTAESPQDTAVLQLTK